MTYNKDGSVRKPGSGRTKGAVSLVSVRFGDLKGFVSDDAQIKVGRKFLESIGFLVQHKMELEQDSSGKINPIVKTFNPKTKKWETQ